ncbi:tetratricopeptide repeat protein [Cerasicoccus maritimus]|uniref:tetratricopeptide repeat protein n=1 Tax=Cerasicoccus maritimus TaxID=490089 RepID=UPI002852A517|nr:hypothetical protein [Cerasicoccus maritimus]
MLLSALYIGYIKWVRYETQMAYELVEAGQANQALRHLKRLQILQPTSNENKLLYAKAKALEAPEEALPILESLSQDTESDTFKEAALAYLELSIQLKKYESATSFISKMAPKMSGDTHFMLLKAQNLLLLGDSEAAIKELTYLINIEPNNAYAQFLRATILLQQPRITNWIEAKSALKEASQSNSSIGLDALKLLSTRPEIKLFPQERQWLISRLSQHPRRKITSKLLAATHRIILDDSARESVIEQIISEESTAHPLEVCNWLIDINEPQRAEDLLEAPELAPSQERWQLQYRAAVQRNDLQKINKLLNLDYSAASTPQKATLILYLRLQEGKMVSKEEWDQTLDLAQEEGEIDSLTVLARTAGTQNWWDRSDTAYRAAIELAPNQLVAANLQKEHLTVVLFMKNTSEALEISTILRQIYPSNPIYQNNYYYFSNLLGHQEPNQIIILSEIQKQSKLRELNSTIAFLLYLNGQYTEAKERLSNIPETLKRQPSVILLNGLIEKELGNDELSNELLSAINPNQLLPEENKLLKAAKESNNF